MQFSDILQYAFVLLFTRCDFNMFKGSILEEKGVFKFFSNPGGGGGVI